MPPRFEHEHEHDLVADLGVSSVERSAALRLCGESPSGLGVWGSGFWGSEHNRARARSPFKTPSRQCETGPLSRGSLPPFHPSILPSFHPFPSLPSLHRYTWGCLFCLLRILDCCRPDCAPGLPLEFVCQLPDVRDNQIDPR